MDGRAPFVLLDDARDGAGQDALLYDRPSRVFVAQRGDDVAATLEAAHAALQDAGGAASLAGYIAYEAGYALEPRLAPLADRRSGGAGPLVWFGLFEEAERIAAADVPAWLRARTDSGAPKPGLSPLYPQLSFATYRKQIASLQNAIRAGDIYQANFTFPLAGGFLGDPVGLYRELRPAGQAGYGGLIFDGSHWLLSFSPELFVSVKDRDLRAKPMKGTRPRSIDPAEDDQLREGLAASEKDRAENLMIVDLMRNDLSRIAEPSSVKVRDPFTVETYPTVHQMVSTIEARLQGAASPVDLLRALFPCGSITGAPKIRAMELLAEQERDARGPYCGAIGRIGANGDAAFNVAIRTLRLTEVENHRGKAVLGVGSAIIADSDPAEEWRECLVKGQFARASSHDLCAPAFDLIETMRFDPEEGIALLEYHLLRMKESAQELGFTFDRHETRNQIQALCFSLEHDSKLRLSLARSGAIALEAQTLTEGWPNPVKVIALPLPVDPGDWRLRHKTTDRDFYDDALEQAREAGAHEAIFVRDDGLVTEGCITNVFADADDDEAMRTPPLSLGLLPGALRADLIKQGRALEANLTLDDLADGFLIGNSVRGLVRAELLRP